MNKFTKSQYIKFKMHVLVFIDVLVTVENALVKTRLI